MLEMGGTASASLCAATSAAGPILGQAAITAPCPLSAPELSCLISLRHVAALYFLIVFRPATYKQQGQILCMGTTVLVFKHSSQKAGDSLESVLSGQQGKS